MHAHVTLKRSLDPSAGVNVSPECLMRYILMNEPCDCHRRLASVSLDFTQQILYLRIQCKREENALHCMLQNFEAVCKFLGNQWQYFLSWWAYQIILSKIIWKCYRLSPKFVSPGHNQYWDYRVHHVVVWGGCCVAHDCTHTTDELTTMGGKEGNIALR